jgi:hypothetical protein
LQLPLSGERGGRNSDAALALSGPFAPISELRRERL